MPFVNAAPNFECTGVISGFVLGEGTLLAPSITRGVLFAQEGKFPSRLRRAIDPASQPLARSWKFHNLLRGFYWQAWGILTATMMQNPTAVLCSR